MLSNKKKIALVCMMPYPIGNVSTMRIHSYCKSLVNAGCYVKVLVITPNKNNVNTDDKGECDGVFYEYLNGRTWKNDKNKLKKIFIYIIGLCKSINQIKKEKFDILLTYHSEIISNILYYIFTRFYSIPFAIDKTEYPYYYKDKSSFGKKMERIKLIFFDGFIVISDELKIFYSQISKNVFLLPMTIDPDRFKGVVRNDEAKPYIAVVFGVHNRDCINDSVMAYALYRNEVEIPYDLWLIGDFNDLCNRHVECKYIYDFILKENLQECIKFIGTVENKEVPQILCNARCLLTTAREYVSGGFPTKLGEYMLSGVPVLATCAGEIGNYVTDKHNIYLAKPSNITDIASKLSYIQTNYEEALHVAKNGQFQAKNTFNAATYIDDLLHFLFYLRK